jgi:hypothetical protein
MKRTLVMDGKVIEVMMFRTRQAAKNYIARKGGEMVYFTAHMYCVA